MSIKTDAARSFSGFPGGELPVLIVSKTQRPAHAGRFLSVIN
ncbi:hypothetical protein X965_00600 [Morganella sp. EGD-HP17]|nr:hypothetical protein X965_00600 [Morganella sp. EGD-HP17]